MNTELSGKAAVGVGIAALLWFLMFSPWTAPYVPFWLTMSLAGIILTLWATAFGAWQGEIREALRDGQGQFSLRRLLVCLLLGIGIAVVMWCIFWLGDKFSQLLFSFARPQVNGIYGMKGDTSPLYIAGALLFIIGPAEEIFWRGFVQRFLQHRWGPNTGFVLGTLVYTLIHVWSFNFMLLLAAAVCGVCWGGLYRLDRRLLLPLIISHALWDALAFVILPF